MLKAQASSSFAGAEAKQREPANENTALKRAAPDPIISASGMSDEKDHYFGPARSPYRA